MSLMLALVMLLAITSGQPATAADDAILWSHYEAWVARLSVLPPGERKPMADRYVEQLVSEGVSKAEALQRYQRISVIRRESSAKEMVYWQIDDARWPVAFGKALRPDGIVVFQTSLNPRRSVAELAALWKDFQILRVEDLDAGMEMNDWAPSRTLPTARLVARKESAK